MASAAIPRQAALRGLLRRGISTHAAASCAAGGAATCTPRRPTTMQAAAAVTACNLNLNLFSSASASGSGSGNGNGNRPRWMIAALRTSAAAGWRSGSGSGSGSGVLRRFSTGTSGENDVPNSRIWKFDEIKQLVEHPDAAKEEVVLIDVREPGELLETGRIPGAINIPITTAVQSFHISDQDFEDVYGFARPPKDAHLVFYCRAGVRARSAAGLAQHAGWTNVGEYPGSWLDWETHRGPVEKV